MSAAQTPKEASATDLAEHPPLRDDEFAALFETAEESKAHVLVVVNGYTALAAKRARPQDSWEVIGQGEFGTLCLEAAERLIDRKTLFWHEVEQLPSESILPDAPQKAGKRAVRKWVKEANELADVSGRGVDLSDKLQRHIWLQAAGRCQFPECGENLFIHPTRHTPGNFGYLAHIVASSPKGPRGTEADSHRLSADPTNFLLLCDACHRLIDRVAPGAYPTDYLQRIRSQSISNVERILDSLKYKEVQPITILGTIAGQVPRIAPEDINEALWPQGLRSGSQGLESLFHTGGDIHDPHTSLYWDSISNVLPKTLTRLQDYLTGASRQGGSRPRLAIFPLASISLLVLSGRVIGDTNGVHIFHPHRNDNASASRSRWAWPPDASPPPDGKFGWRVLQNHTAGITEACLLISLTFSITAERLPAPSAQDGVLSLPTIEVFTEANSTEAIAHPEDLTQFGSVIHEAMTKLQDEWKVSKVHLFVASPATAAFVVGQKMQGRHHATYIVHESERGAGAIYTPTLEIAPKHAKPTFLNQQLPL